MPMRTDATLTLAQWLSPAFPVGAFAYSSGLESAIHMGHVAPDTLEAWLAALLDHGQGCTDAILIRAAACADPAQADAMSRATCASAERLLEITAQGTAFCAQLRAHWGYDGPDLTYPTALGHGAFLHDLPVDLAVQLYLHAWVSTLISAAQRLMPLGQTQAQGILHGLAPLCCDIAQATTDSTIDDIASHSFLADITAMQHETQAPRIFRT